MNVLFQMELWLQAAEAAEAGAEATAEAGAEAGQKAGVKTRWKRCRVADVACVFLCLEHFLCWEQFSLRSCEGYHYQLFQQGLIGMRMQQHCIIRC